MRRPEKYQSRVNTLSTMKDFLFNEYMDFRMIAYRYYFAL